MRYERPVNFRVLFQDAPVNDFVRSIAHRHGRDEMTSSTYHLLVIEDSEPLGRQIVAALQGAGYETDWIQSGDRALSAQFDRYDLVILDLLLPGASGFSILEHMRRQGTTTPVLIASAFSDSRDKQRAFDSGATDYLTKPFWPQELLDRVASHLALPQPALTTVLAIGELTLDFARRVVHVNELRIDLTPVEFDVMESLARARGEPVSRATLFAFLEYEASDRSEALNRCVSAIKLKLGPPGDRIQTVWGIGYCLATQIP